MNLPAPARLRVLPQQMMCPPHELWPAAEGISVSGQGPPHVQRSHGVNYRGMWAAWGDAGGRYALEGWGPLPLQGAQSAAVPLTPSARLNGSGTRQ